MEMVRNGTFDPTFMITHRFSSLEEIPAAYEKLHKKQDGYIKVFVTPNGPAVPRERVISNAPFPAPLSPILHHSPCSQFVPPMNTSMSTTNIFTFVIFFSIVLRMSGRFHGNYDNVVYLASYSRTLAQNVACCTLTPLRRLVSFMDAGCDHQQVLACFARSIARRYVINDRLLGLSNQPVWSYGPSTLSRLA
jgi:hypothetical protein